MPRGKSLPAEVGGVVTLSKAEDFNRGRRLAPQEASASSPTCLGAHFVPGSRGSPRPFRPRSRREKSPEVTEGGGSRRGRRAPARRRVLAPTSSRGAAVLRGPFAPVRGARSLPK